jgi:hypothetical protein
VAATHEEASHVYDSRQTREFTLSLNWKGRFLSAAEIGDAQQYHDFIQLSAAQSLA